MSHRRHPPSLNFATQPWRQVRIFIKDTRPGEGYLNLLGYLALPLLRWRSATPFFFTRYGPMVKGVDDTDTKIEEMPAEWLLDLDGQKKHLSLKLRFMANNKAESFIVQRLNSAKNLYWYSDVQDYQPSGFSEDRVFVGANPTAELNRRGVVADLLCANARFVLDNLELNAGQWSFQANPQGNPCPTNFRFALHMMNNTYGFPNGASCPVGYGLLGVPPTVGFLDV